MELNALLTKCFVGWIVINILDKLCKASYFRCGYEIC